MTTQQVLLFALIFVVLATLLWGRYRHDVVAACGLFAGVLVGVVPERDAFAGFSHPAVIIVALALIASRAIENSGALSLLVRPLLNRRASAPSHIVVAGGLGAIMSAFINNVAALAILMPADLEAAKRAKRSPAITLMPLSFATILGGMVTLIGTPPNIIASHFRADRLGEPYAMFDFTPVGLVVASVGLAYMALVGWRLVPRRQDEATQKVNVEQFFAEVRVPENSVIVGKVPAECDAQAEANDVNISGVIRDGTEVPNSRYSRIEADDRLLIEGPVDGIAAFIKELHLQPLSPTEGEPTAARLAHDVSLVQAVVRADSFLAGRSVAAAQLRSRFHVTLLGVSRDLQLIRQDLKSRTLEPGDMLLFCGPPTALKSAVEFLRLIPVTYTDASRFSLSRIILAVAPFALAIIAASAGVLSFTIGLAIAVVAYAVSGLIPAREFYSQIEWPGVVMLACLLPLGMAFDKVGGTSLIAESVLFFTSGNSPVVALIILMIVTMTLSDVLNSLATMVIAAPLAITLALKLGVNPDPFLMGVTIAASCSFLTPIGHKNNTLILGPGGYRFSDYWRVGLPLEVLVLLVAVPALLIVWPLNGQ